MSLCSRFASLASIFAVLLLAATAPAQARMLITNANGYTLDADGRLVRFAAMLVDDWGRVEQTYGRDERLPRFKRRDGVERVDMGGRTLMPGLIDAHGHVMGLGEAALTVDLAGTKSLEEALERVRAYAAANPSRRWIVGRGWNQVAWGLGRFPTAAELDRAVKDRPVYLARVDGHAGWANTAALRAAKITADMPDPPGGRIERDPANGVPTGVFIDAAEELVTRHIPPPTASEREAALKKALEIMASVGLTGVHDAGVTPETWMLYRDFGDRGLLTARIYAMAAGLEAVDAIAPLRPTPWLYGDRLTMRAVKLYADGALGSRGAWMLAPYSDDPDNTGLRFHNEARLMNMISRTNFMGFQAAVHAIGDAANREVLDAFAEMRGTYGEKLRNRVEHAQIVAPDDLDRFAKLNVIASVQPTHATSDKAMAEDRVGPERIRGGYAWATLLKSGARVALGSDFPVEPANPFYGLHAAVTRRDREGQPPGGWYPQEALTLEQALRGFTLDAAYAGFAEEKVGSLTRGKWADFILLDRDPFAIAPDELWRVQVDETWLAGQPVFRRPRP